jgi:hypothetical protein
MAKSTLSPKAGFLMRRLEVFCNLAESLVQVEPHAKAYNPLMARLAVNARGMQLILRQFGNPRADELAEQWALVNIGVIGRVKSAVTGSASLVLATAAFAATQTITTQEDTNA